MNRKHIIAASFILLIIVILSFFNNKINNSLKKNETQINDALNEVNNGAGDGGGEDNVVIELKDNFYKISEIKSQNLSSGIYYTDGYVIKKYTCPPCPSGALCKPCMGSNIVISESDKIIQEYNLTNSEIILFTNNPEKFELGKKYQFNINILENRTTTEPINNIEIIDYAEINDQKMTESQARQIAEKSCIKGGESLSAGMYNEITKTWWFDANLNATKPGCNPACVVIEETKSAELNWRCTGLLPPNEIEPAITPVAGQCGIENCHGLDIVCGPNPAEMCTAMYQFGDRCRQYAKCGLINGKCQEIQNSKFNECKTCVKKCEDQYKNNDDQMWMCEIKCGDEII